MQHERPPQMPEESGQPVWGQPEADGRSSGRHRDQTAGRRRARRAETEGFSCLCFHGSA